MLERHEARSGRPASVVQCPQRVAGDGQSVVCSVTRGDRGRARYRITRRGGSHRMVELPAEDAPTTAGQ